MVAELFDPRTAKTKIGRIAAGGTLGGLVGGIIAERAGTLFSVSAMMPILAGLHLICALVNRQLRRRDHISASPVDSKVAPSVRRSGLQVLRDVPYLKQLALLVLTATVAETMLDYLLKAEASAAYSQTAALMRFFAIFYTGISLVTFLVQAALSKYFLQQVGLAGTVLSMPLAVVAGGILTFVRPGLIPIAIARSMQAVLRSSLFRSGYELLYAPVPRDEKRATKILVDVGFDRIGDALGGGLIQVVLVLGLAASASNSLLSAVAITLGGVAVILTYQISRGYVSTLEKSLLNQAAELDLLNTDERTTRTTMLRTLGTIDLGNLLATRRDAVTGATASPGRLDSSKGEGSPAVQRILDLQSESSAVVRTALKSRSFLDPLEIAPVIRLLARDDVSEDAVKALRATAATTIGQLTDALLNADEDFATRRRIPRVLADCKSQRAIDGLMAGLADTRFEVRFSCGRALSRICVADNTLRPQPESVYVATRREIAAAHRLAEAPRVLDHYEDVGDPMPPDESWSTTDIRLEHIFRLLSLCLPKEPLQVAFQAFHTHDTYLRGTALEYLESVLPPDIRDGLWKFIEERRVPTRPPSAGVQGSTL
jgi:hypothetical protein